MTDQNQFANVLINISMKKNLKLTFFIKQCKKRLKFLKQIFATPRIHFRRSLSEKLHHWLLCFITYRGYNRQHALDL